MEIKYKGTPHLIFRIGNAIDCFEKQSITINQTFGYPIGITIMKKFFNHNQPPSVCPTACGAALPVAALYGLYIPFSAKSIHKPLSMSLMGVAWSV